MRRVIPMLEALLPGGSCAIGVAVKDGTVIGFVLRWTLAKEYVDKDGKDITLERPVTVAKSDMEITADMVRANTGNFAAIFSKALMMELHDRRHDVRERKFQSMPGIEIEGDTLH